MPGMQEIPHKPYYKISEVCQYTDTQPYVLSFWESEFPQLKPEKSRGGQSVYRKDDIELVLRIKHLLYQEEFTIDGARRRLEEERGGSTSSDEGRAPPVAADEEPLSGQEARSGRQDGLAFDMVPRERYEDAVDEIAHLRLKLKEAEAQLKRTHGALNKSEENALRHRKRGELSISRLERLLELLS